MKESSVLLHVNLQGNTELSSVLLRVEEGKNLPNTLCAVLSLKINIFATLLG